jgi:hypothetical protein
MMYHRRRSFTEDREQSFAIEPQTETILPRKCDQLVLPVAVICGADVLQFVLENGAMLVLVK